MEKNNNLLQHKVTELCKWKKLAAEASAEIKKLEAEIQEAGIADLSETKDKTVSYAGENPGEIAEVTLAVSPKLLLEAGIKNWLGDTGKEFWKETTKVEPTKEFMKIVTPILLGEYSKTTLQEALMELSKGDGKTYELLKKKIKGTFKSDVKTLTSVGVEDPVTAAYYLAEIIAWDRYISMLKSMGMDVPNSDAVEVVTEELQELFAVEETVRIAVKYEEPKK